MEIFEMMAFLCIHRYNAWLLCPDVKHCLDLSSTQSGVCTVSKINPVKVTKGNRPYVEDEKRCYDGVNSVAESLHSLFTERLVGQVRVEQDGVWTLRDLTWNMRKIYFIFKSFWFCQSTSGWTLRTDGFVATPLETLGDVGQEDHNG